MPSSCTALTTPSNQFSPDAADTIAATGDANITDAAGDANIAAAAGDASAALAGTADNGLVAFFAHGEGWRVALDLFFIAFFGGLYAVPLNAIMQHRSPSSRRSRVIAANNVMNAVFMIASALAGAVLLKVMSAQGFFLLLGLANAVVSVCDCQWRTTRSSAQQQCGAHCVPAKPTSPRA